MAVGAGVAYVDILPAFDQFGKRLTAGIVPEVAGAAKKAGASFEAEMDRSGKKAGAALADGTEKGAAAATGSLTRLGSSAKSSLGLITSAASGAGGGLNPLVGSLGNVSGAMSHLDAGASRSTKTLVGVGAGAAGVGVLLTRMGDESKQATAQLRTAIDNTGNSFSDFEKDVDQVSKRLIKLGFDDEATARSLATLTTATQDPAKALEHMGLVADIAAARHISLESAADKVAKGLSGNNRIFKEFGITLDANATSTERAAAMQELAGRVQGQAAAQADNLSGKWKSLRIQAENLAESVGEKVGPALTIAGPLLAGLGGIVQSGLLPKLAEGVRGLGLFTTAQTVAGDASVVAAGKIGVLNTALGAGALGKLGTLGAAIAAVYAGSKAGDHLSDLIDKEESLGVKIDRQINKVPLLGSAFQALGITHRTTGESARKQAEDEDVLAAAEERAAEMANRQKEATDLLKAASDRAKAALGEMTSKLNELIGVHVAADQAAITYEGAIDDLTAKLTTNGQTIDVTSEKGRENRRAIDSVITGITGHIDALAREGASMDELKGTFNNHVEDLKSVMRQAGFTEGQINDLITKYGLIPEKVVTAFEVVGKAAYDNALADGRLQWEDFVAIAGVENAPNSPYLTMPRGATGGLLPQRVGEGFVTNGPRAIVGEGRQMYPEYVIPTDPAYRDREVALFNALGQDLDLMATGGVLGDRPTVYLPITVDMSKVIPSLPSPPALKGPGGSAGPTGTIGSGWQAITDFLDSVGQDYTVTSAYRPGDPGFHGKGKAVDLVGDMFAIFHALEGLSGINELFFDPIGYFIDEGARHSGAIGDHDDHVHAATFDRGGWLQPGMTAAWNGTGQAEPVGIDYDRMARVLARELARELAQVTVVADVGQAARALEDRRRARR